MKFRDWDDFVAEINELGRRGYIKKQTKYDHFNKTNTMIMQHKHNLDEIILVLYDDDELFDLDYGNEAYVKQNKKFEQPREDIQKSDRVWSEKKTDLRTKDHRSPNYPEKPFVKKEEVPEDKEDSPLSESENSPPASKPAPPKPRPPKPGPSTQKKDDS